MSPAKRADIGYALGILLGVSIVVGSGFVDVYASHVGANDWSGIWAGPRAFLEGVDPYDASRWSADASRLQRQRPDTAVYGYPAWTLLALLPLGAMPYGASGAVWTILGIAVAIVGLRALLRAFAPGLAGVHGLSGLMLTASQPAITSFDTGQWGFLLVGLVSLSLVALRAERAGTAGGLLAMCALAKPQLFALTVLAVGRAAAARGLGRAIVAFVAVCALAVGASLAVLPRWPAAYADVAVGRLPGAPRFATLPAALEDLGGTAGKYLAAIVVIALVAAALAFDPRSDASLAAGLAVSSAVAPYAWAYDQLLLVVPLAIAAGAVAPRSPRRAAVLIGSGAVVLLVVATVLHGVFNEARRSESYNGLVPAIVASLVIVSLWPQRRIRLLRGV